MSQGTSLRRGARIAVDVGSVRVGVARCDPDGILATPVATLARSDGDTGLGELCRLVAEHDALEVVVGLPRSLSGNEGHAAQAARDYARQLATACAPVPVRLVDERLSTVSAHQALHAAGRREKQHRAVIDQAAAVVILEQALDAERRTGTAPGELLAVPASGKEEA